MPSKFCTVILISSALTFGSGSGYRYPRLQVQDQMMVPSEEVTSAIVMAPPSILSGRKMSTMPEDYAMKLQKTNVTEDIDLIQAPPIMDPNDDIMIQNDDDVAMEKSDGIR